MTTTMHAIEPATETSDKALAEISELLNGETGPVSLQDAAGRKVTLSPEVAGAFQTVIEALIKRQPSILYPKRALLTTQQAADYLGTSRPSLIKLLDEGKLPFTTTGSHRRILFIDLHAFRVQMDEQRLRGIEEIVRISEEAGLYELEAQMIEDVTSE